MELFFRVTGPLCGKSPVTGEFPHKDQWRGALMFSLIYAWRNGWVNNQCTGDLRRHRAHYDVTAMNSPVLSMVVSLTETKMSSFWRNFNHLLHWKLSFWQLSVQPVMKISSKWRHFRFSAGTRVSVWCHTLAISPSNVNTVVWSIKGSKSKWSKAKRSWTKTPLTYSGQHSACWWSGAKPCWDIYKLTHD